MKKFKGNKPFQAIKEEVIRNGWPWDQSRYDQGGDWVTFGFMHDDNRIEVVYNSFNGRFMVKMEDGEIVTERSDELDGTDWYDALLDFVYEPEDEKKIA